MEKDKTIGVAVYRRIGAEELNQGLSNAALTRQDKDRINSHEPWHYVATYSRNRLTVRGNAKRDP
jgi:hypothetical protein